MEKEEKAAIPPEKLTKILDTAQKRFAHYGLAKTTMNDIADDLGVSKASLYYYFPDKECIFKKVMAREQGDFCSRMQDLLNSNKKLEAMLIKYIEHRMEYLNALINLGHLTQENFMASKAVYAALSKEFFERERDIIAKMLKKAAEKNEISKINIEEYAGFFVHVLRALRLYNFNVKELWEKGTMDQEIKKEYMFFTKLFLKSIEK